MQDDTLTNSGERETRPVIVVDGKLAYEQFASIRDFLFGLSAKGIATALVLPPDVSINAGLWPQTEIIFYPLLRLPLFRKQNHKNLMDELEKFKPTVVHCIGTAKISLAKSISENFGIPAIVSLNSAVIPRMSIPKIKVGISNVITPSQSIADKLRKKYGVISHLVKCIDFGTFVDESCACFSEMDRLPSMIMAGAMDNFQRFEPLLSALRHLAVDGNEFLAVLMGDGKAKKKIKEFVSAVGLGQAVNLVDKRKPYQDIFRGTDIYVQLDSLSNGWQGILQAGSSGLAVAARKADMGELLNAGQNAVAFDEADELSIYSALQKLLTDKTMARNLAMGLQNNLRDNHSVSDMVNEFVKIYTSS